jgi:hypothetical protein
MNSQSIVAVRQASVSDLDLLVPMFDAYGQFYRRPSDLDLTRQLLRERFQHNQSIISLLCLTVRQPDSRSYFPAIRRHLPRGFRSSTTCFAAGSASQEGRIDAANRGGQLWGGGGRRAAHAFDCCGVSAV